MGFYHISMKPEENTYCLSFFLTRSIKTPKTQIYHYKICITLPVYLRAAMAASNLYLDESRAMATTTTTTTADGLYYCCYCWWWWWWWWCCCSLFDPGTSSKRVGRFASADLYTTACGRPGQGAAATARATLSYSTMKGWSTHAVEAASSRSLGNSRILLEG